MAPEEALKLRPGDIVLWKGKVLRTVISVHPKGFITFKILKRSWTNRFWTTYLLREASQHIEFHSRPVIANECIDMHHEEQGPTRAGRHLYDHEGNLL